MNNLNNLLKFNGLIFLFLGALFIFIPNQLISFLSLSDQAPELIVVIMGMTLNFLGLMVLWQANKSEPNKRFVQIISISDIVWAFFSLGMVFTNTWVTTTHGTTTVGLTAISVGWIGWLLLQNHTDKQ